MDGMTTSSDTSTLHVVLGRSRQPLPCTHSHEAGIPIDCACSKAFPSLSSKSLLDSSQELPEMERTVDNFQAVDSDSPGALEANMDNVQEEDQTSIRKVSPTYRDHATWTMEDYGDRIRSGDIIESIEMNVPENSHGHSNHTGSNLTGTLERDVDPSSGYLPQSRKRRHHTSDEDELFAPLPVRDIELSSPLSSGKSESIGGRVFSRTPPSTPEQESYHLSEPTFRKVLRPSYPLRLANNGPQAWSLERSRYWVKHDYSIFRPPEDIWRQEPDVDIVKGTILPVLRLLGSDFVIATCKVTMLATGGFNSVYNISIQSSRASTHEFIMRVPIPIYPYYKTESDVATTEFVRHFTSIPVPIIYAYDSSCDNKLGLEWMLMEKVDGAPLDDLWLDLDNETHIKITEQVATWQHELAQITNTAIGGLYLRWTTTHLEFYIGRTVNSFFYWNRRQLYNIPRGPFESINDFYHAFLSVMIQEMFDPVYLLLARNKLAPEQEEELERLKPHKEAILSELDEEERKDIARHGPHYHWKATSLATIRALQTAIPTINPPTSDDDTTTMLLHDDISICNLMLDARGNITALLDWEHNEFKPSILTSSCAYPKFIDYPEIDQRESDEIKRLSSYNDPTELWDAIALEQHQIVASHLRPIYKGRLKELESSLVRLFDEESTFEEELRDWVMDPTGKERGLAEWLSFQLEEDEEEDDSDEGEEEPAGKQEIG